MGIETQGPDGATPSLEMAINRNLWNAFAIVPVVGGLLELARESTGRRLTSAPVTAEESMALGRGVTINEHSPGDGKEGFGVHGAGPSRCCSDQYRFCHLQSNR